MPLFTLARAGAGLALVSLLAQPAYANEPPKVFSDVGVTMQSRICGELMTSLAMGGIQAMKMQFKGGEVPLASRKDVYSVGAEAIVLLSMAGSLKLEERLKAGEIAASIEAMEPSVHVEVARLCRRRIAAWLQHGEVNKGQLTQAYAQAKQLLDKAFSANGQDEDN